jgi:hypothetical protein
LSADHAASTDGRRADHAAVSRGGLIAAKPAHSTAGRRLQPPTVMRLLPLVALVFLLGCPPPPPPPAPPPLPAVPVAKKDDPKEGIFADEETPPPAKPAPQIPAEPAPLTSEAIADVISRARTEGVITAFPYLKVHLRGDKRIEVEGVTSLKVGPQLEFLACSRRGKSYESLMIWLCEPEHLQLSLLFLGLEPTPQVTDFGQPGALTKGQKVRLDVEWEDPTTKQKVARRIEDLLYDTNRDGCMKYAGWVFTGSRHIDAPQPPNWDTTKRVFASTTFGSIASVYHDPDAILDTPLAEGGNNSSYVAWAKRLPERHTPIVVTIRPWKEGDDAEPKDWKRAPNEEHPPGGGPPGGGGEEKDK